MTMSSNKDFTKDNEFSLTNKPFELPPVPAPLTTKLFSYANHGQYKTKKEEDSAPPPLEEPATPVRTASKPIEILRAKAKAKAQKKQAEDFGDLLAQLESLKL